MYSVKTKDVIAIMKSLGFKRGVRSGHAIFDLPDRNIKITFPVDDEYMLASYVEAVAKQLDDWGLMERTDFKRKVGAPIDSHRPRSSPFSRR